MSKWIQSTVGDVTAYQKAGGTPLATNSQFYGGDIPFVVIEDMTKSSRFLEVTEKSLTAKGLQSSAAWLIREPHILYSMYATVGKPVISKIACATNQAIIALKENHLVDQSFLFYCLVFIRPGVWKYTAQTTQSNLNAGVVRRLPVSYPENIDEQQKIVRIIQSIDQAIEKTEALIEKYQQIKAGLMHDLSTRGIGADGKLRPPREQAPELYQETPIGWIPKEWGCLKLKNATTNITDGDHHTPMRAGEGVYLLSARNVLNGEIALMDVDYVPEIEYQRMIKRCHPETGDVLISCSGTIGRVAVVPSGLKCCLVRSAALAKPDTNVVTGAFLEKILQSAILQLQIKASQKQAAQPNLFQGQIEALLVPVPDGDEQTKILACLRPCDSKLKGLISERSKLTKLKSGLMHDLLTGKKKVTVDQPEAANV